MAWPKGVKRGSRRIEGSGEAAFVKGPEAPRAKPDSINLYELLPLEEALKEALYDLGADDRYKTAVKTSALGERLHILGFGRGRAVANTTFDLRDIADAITKPKTVQQQQLMK